MKEHYSENTEVHINFGCDNIKYFLGLFTQ